QHDRALEQHGLLRGARRQAAPLHAAGGRRKQAVQEAHQNALAGAVGAEHGGEAAALQLQVHAIENLLVAGGETKRMRLQGEHGGSGGLGGGIHFQPPRAAQPRMKCAMALSSSTRLTSTMPSPSARGRSPLLVSSAIAVVMTRVTPSILPPTIMT